MKKILLFLSSFIMFLNISTVYGHGGRTNAYGCHNDNVHGGYHCHNNKIYHNLNNDSQTYHTDLDYSDTKEVIEEYYEEIHGEDIENEAVVSFGDVLVILIISFVVAIGIFNSIDPRNTTNKQALILFLIIFVITSSVLLILFFMAQ